MYEFDHTLPDKFRLFLLGLLIPVAIVMMIMVVPPAAETSSGYSPSSHSLTMSASDNAVTVAITSAADTVSRTLYNSEQAIISSHRSAHLAIKNSVSQTGTFIASGAKTIVSTIGNVLGSGIRFVGHGFSGIGRGLATVGRFIVKAASLAIAAIVYVPHAFFGYAADTAIVSAAIRPAGDAPVPTITATMPVTLTTKATLPEVQAVSHVEPITDTQAAWPVHGNITTLFGVPHWPYQPTHTGIDISDGRPSGTTPVKPYKPGVVTQTNKSYFGLGNSIIVDHGHGVTSVYGHLASIGVQAGQTVDKNTVLGYQGTTGASTGTHLHFEIRIDGKAVDPRQFITGHP